MVNSRHQTDLLGFRAYISFKCVNRYGVLKNIPLCYNMQTIVNADSSVKIINAKRLCKKNLDPADERVLSKTVKLTFLENE